MAHRAYVTEVDINTQEIRIELYPKAKLDVTKIPALIAEYKTALRFAQGGEKPVLFYQEKGKKNKNCEPMIEKAKEIHWEAWGAGGEQKIKAYGKNRACEKMRNHFFTRSFRLKNYKRSSL